MLTPTRELALQIFGVAQQIMSKHSQTVGIVMGGANRRSEVEKLEKGVNLLIAVPGRLLDHLQVCHSHFLFKTLGQGCGSLISLCRIRKASYIVT